MQFVWVGLGFMAFMSATTLAIDVGMFMTARSQAQNAADAGALAGATALAFNDYEDRTIDGPAVLSARNTAVGNTVIQGAPSVLASDVSFPLSPAGIDNRVRVNVFRTAPRSNAIPTLMGPFFGVPTVNVSATATAEASPANTMTCVKPFTIPDRWRENQDPPWTVDSSYDRYDNKGKLLPDADEYIKPGQPGYQGYNQGDVGTVLTIRAGTGNNVSPSFYFSWKMPGGTGADFYRENIGGCNSAKFQAGAEMVQEPGNMVGPTTQGVDELLALDPDAYWDPDTRAVKSEFHPSPRVFPIPLYDPEAYESGKQNGRGATLVMTNWIGFFVEGRNGNNVFGRIVPITGEVDGEAPGAPDNSLAIAIRLVK